MLDECLDVVEFFDLANVARAPWKNGGGSTRELVCWPPGADMDGFEWRVSVATIAAQGPFSPFPGVDRQIMLLEGDGVHLRGLRQGWDHALDRRWQPYSFAGDEPVDCRMLGGVSTDFNLMLRRGVWRGGMQVVQTAQTAAGRGAGLCMVLAGTWRWSDGSAARTLAAGQGAWWVLEEGESRPTRAGAADGDGEGGAGSPWSVAPVARDGSEPPVLVWVAMQPVDGGNI